MNGEDYREIFVPDSGAFLDIYIFDTTSRDWQVLLDYVSSHYAVSYSEDGHGRPMPRYDLIRERCKSTTVSLEINLSGVAANCHFFEVGHMEVDVLPEDVNGPERAKSVFEFMIAIARLLKKEVFLTPESASATQAETQRNCALHC